VEPICSHIFVHDSALDMDVVTGICEDISVTTVTKHKNTLNEQTKYCYFCHPDKLIMLFGYHWLRKEVGL
jgi:hypothetical protein